MEKVDILTIALCIVIIIFVAYIAYLKAGITFCIQMIVHQQHIVEGLSKSLENNNVLLNKQRELNDNQVAINKAQLKFNKDIENIIKANSVNHHSLRGVAEAKRRHNSNSNSNSNNYDSVNNSIINYILESCITRIYWS